MAPPESETLADFLYNLLAENDKSASWLAVRIGSHPSSISRWLDGSTYPTLNALIRVRNVFGLDEESSRRLFDLAGYADTQIYDVNKSPNSSLVEAERNNLQEEIRAQINDLQKSMQSFSSQSEGSTQQLTQIIAEVDYLKTTILDLTKVDNLSVPIILPDRKEMSPRLVSSQALDRLEEYRSDEQKVSIALGLVGGALLGVLINWATMETIVYTRASVLVLVILAALTVFCIYWLRRIGERVVQAKAKMLDGPTVPYQGDGGANEE